MDGQVTKLFNFIDDISENGFMEISPETRFWMVRSKAGFFYNEFIKKGFIAIGWNCIDKSTDLSDENLPQHIIESHDFVTKKGGQTTRIINKCNYFINEMKTNDIVIIPNKGMSEISIALVGEYFENKKATVEKENEVTHKLNVDSLNSIVEECPYIKRREITFLRRVEANRINYHLYQTLRNYNGIDDIDEHATAILGLLFDVFIYKDSLFYSFDVNKKEAIPLKELSKLLYGTSCYFDEYVDEEKITTKVNVCSEGTVEISIQQINELINIFGVKIFLIFVCLIGFGYLATKIDIPKLITDIIAIPTRYRKERLQEEMLKVDLDLKRCELESKRTENMGKGIDVNQMLTSVGGKLEIKPKELMEASKGKIVMLNTKSSKKNDM